MSAAGALQLPVGMAGNNAASIGTGVDVTAFRRIRTNFLDLQYRAQAMGVGDQETLSRQLDQVEMALAEPGDNGIASQLSKFWNGWADVSNNPDDPAARQALIDQAKNLAAAFKGLDTQLTTVKGQALSEYGALTGAGGDVQLMATEISQLNAAIRGLVSGGDSPNDMMDRRAPLLDQLSKPARVPVPALGNGSVTVKFGGAAVALLSDTTVNWPQPLTAPGGTLGALLNVSHAGRIAAQSRAQLNPVVKTLAD